MKETRERRTTSNPNISHININPRQRKDQSHQEKEVTNQREQVTRLKE